MTAQDWKYEGGRQRHYVSGPSWYDEECGLMEKDDALLIAAAPELLNCLKRFVSNFEYWLMQGLHMNQDEHELYKRSKDAIGKVVEK